MKRKIKDFIPFAVIIPLLIILYILYGQLGGPDPNSVTYSLDDHWTVHINDTVYEDVSLSSFKFDMPKRGDVVYFYSTLPEEEVVSPLLKFFTTHGAIEVSVDGKEIFRHGHESYEQGVTTGYGDLLIPLPADYMGKQLAFRLIVGETNSFSFFETPTISSQNTYYRDTTITYRAILACNLFLYVFGYFLLVVSIFFLFKNLSFYKLACVAMFSICVATWSICNYDLITLFTYDMRVKTWNEFGSLYMSPLLIFTYFAQDALCRGNKFRKIAYIVLEAIFALFVVVTYTLQFTHILHFPGVLTYCHILVGIGLLYLLYMFIDDFRLKAFKRSVLLTGLMAMLVLVVGDMIIYNLQRYTTLVTNDGYTSSIYIGMLLFVLALFGDFCSGVYNTLYDNATKATLEKLAYADYLTGLANRRQCELLFDELDASQAPYVLITFDLNDLKRINDNYGHLEGDRYIQVFSTVLQKAFKDLGVVARMGGDEFAVVITKVDHADISELTKHFFKLIEEVNRQNEHWNMSTAYGIYYSHEEYASTTHDALRIADTRMYDNKTEMKNNRKSASSSK